MKYFCLLLVLCLTACGVDSYTLHRASIIEKASGMPTYYYEFSISVKEGNNVLGPIELNQITYNSLKVGDIIYYRLYKDGNAVFISKVESP